jgi:hypothetical protein
MALQAIKMNETGVTSSYDSRGDGRGCNRSGEVEAEKESDPDGAF